MEKQLIIYILQRSNSISGIWIIGEKPKRKIMKNVTTGEHAQTSETTRVPAMARKTMLVLTAMLALGSTANLNADDSSPIPWMSTGMLVGVIIGNAINKESKLIVGVGGLLGMAAGAAAHPGTRDKVSRLYGLVLNGPSEKSKRIAAERRLANGGK